MSERFNRGDRVKRNDAGHYAEAWPLGTVARQPRPTSEIIGVQWDGNSSPSNVPAANLDLVERAPPGAFKVNVARGPRKAKTESPLDRADAGYDGDVTIERLEAIAISIRAELHELESRLQTLKFQALIRTSLEAARNFADVEPRTELAADAMKIKADTDKALAAAKRLFK